MRKSVWSWPSNRKLQIANRKLPRTANQTRKDLFMASEALGLLECKGLVSLIEGTDAMLKAANVEMIGWDKAGSGMVTAFVKGDVAAGKGAPEPRAQSAGRRG